MFLKSVFLGVAVMLPKLLSAAPPTLEAKAWVLFDVKSQQVLTSSNADAQFEPASLTKIMTAYLVFSELKQGKIQLSSTAVPSAHALAAVGAKMNLKAKESVTVENLLRGMIIVSGNDAAIALAEFVEGSEARFVTKMNQMAKRLGLKNTNFQNAHGASQAQHYASARDLAMLTNRLIQDFPREYATYYAQKNFTYNGMTQDNRNQLLFQDKTVDGVKTGQTNNAGYCLIASSERNGRRLISVLLGAKSAQMRAQESLRLLNYGFQQFVAVKFYERAAVLKQLDVVDGEKKTVNVGFLDALWLSLPIDNFPSLKEGSSLGLSQIPQVSAQMEWKAPLNAPVQEGEWVGRVRFNFQQTILSERNVVALESVARKKNKSWFDFNHWFQ